MFPQTQSSTQSPSISISFEPGNSMPGAGQASSGQQSPGQMLDQALASFNNNMAQASQQVPAQNQAAPSDASSSSVQGAGGPQGAGGGGIQGLLELMKKMLEILAPLFGQQGQPQANPAAQKAMPTPSSDDAADADAGNDDTSSNNAQTTPQMPNFGNGTQGGFGNSTQGVSPLQDRSFSNFAG